MNLTLIEGNDNEVQKDMLIRFLLLAILTICAVSAGDDADFNDALTVDDAEGVIADAHLMKN